MDEVNIFGANGVPVSVSDLVKEAATADETDASQAQAGTRANGDGTETSQQVPYDRFAEVIKERNEARERERQLQDMLVRMQGQPQQQSQPQQTQLQQQQQSQAPRDFFTEEEWRELEANAIADPISTFKRYGEAILQRGVETRVQQTEQRLLQQMQQYVQQIAPITTQVAVDNFKRQKFSSPQAKAYEPIFDQIVQTATAENPAIATNPQALENLRLLAMGQAAEKGLLNQPVQQHTQQQFLESPGNPNWGGLMPGAPTAIPPQVAVFAQKMGLDPKEAMRIYQLMDQKGVFRG